MNQQRCRRLIGEAISKLELDLSGLTVVTEAATGYYVLTPLIAALAGADQVHALTRDSRYGSAAAVRSRTRALAEKWDVAGRLDILLRRDDPRLAAADIVTNLGFVRPLDREFLARLEKRSAIPLMFETWEYRPEDLDLEECRRLQLPVAGTNEHDARLEIIDYVGMVALKLLLELGVEVFRCRLLLIGGGAFGRAVEARLRGAGATVSQLDPMRERSWVDAARRELPHADGIVVAEHRSRDQLMDPRTGLRPRELKRRNPGIVIAHIAGRVDEAALQEAGLRYRPSTLAPAGHMSVATDYVGPKPLVDLHAAGLKVGEALARAVQNGYTGLAAEEWATRQCPLVQRFGGA